jgi:ParB family chromosome partitioning protein
MSADRQDFVPVALLRPHPANRRDHGDLSELTESVRRTGLLQPVVVEPDPQHPGSYLVTAGARRLAAARAAGMAEVPVTIREPVTRGPAGAIATMLTENWQRLDMGPVEKAEKLGQLRDLGYTPARIAEMTGLRTSTISHYLTFLELDQPTRQRVRDGLVTAGDAVEAVRQARAIRRTGSKAARPKGGKPRPVSVDAFWFNYKHPLADEVQVMCELAGHDQPIARGRSHNEKFGCGRCWEKAIRADERERARPRQPPATVSFNPGGRA